MSAFEQARAFPGKGPDQMFYRMCLTPQELNLWKILHNLAEDRQVRRRGRRYDIALPDDAGELDEYLATQGSSASTCGNSST